MNNNQALFGKYEKGRLLGRGAFAKVYYARNMKNGQSVAIKVIDKKKITGTSLMENIKREISIMRRLRHPNIVRLYEVMASKSKIYFVMEYVKAGELFAKVAKGRFSEDLARKYFQQLVSAIGYCHSRGVFHRDLKPENLLIDDKGDLKVSDFGLSAVKDQIRPESVNDGLLHTLCGTPAYVAPEILTKKGYDGAKVDVWSCGVVLYVLTAGYLPFNDPNLMAMYKKIYKGEFRCPKWMSSDLKRLLSKLFDTNPNTRITLDEITRDPWFLKGCGASFQFSFHKDDYEDEYDQFYLKFEGNHHLDDDVASTSSSIMSSSSSCSLNAFDLISFSSGLDLSGLFDESFNPIVDGDRFVSTEAVHNILETIENVVKDENVNIKLKRRKDYGLDLLGSNGNLVVRFEIRPLTDQLVVVEVMKRAGDSASYNDIWKNMLKPKLSHLVHSQEESTTTEVSPDPEPENSPS